MAEKYLKFVLILFLFMFSVPQAMAGSVAPANPLVRKNPSSSKAPAAKKEGKLPALLSGPPISNKALSQESAEGVKLWDEASFPETGAPQKAASLPQAVRSVIRH